MKGVLNQAQRLAHPWRILNMLSEFWYQHIRALILPSKQSHGMLPGWHIHTPISSFLALPGMLGILGRYNKHNTRYSSLTNLSTSGPLCFWSLNYLSVNVMAKDNGNYSIQTSRALWTVSMGSFCLWLLVRFGQCPFSSHPCPSWRSRQFVLYTCAAQHSNH